MTGQARRLFVLQYGAERVTKALSLLGGDDHLYWEPLYGVLVDTDLGWVLLDTGMGRSALDSPAVTAAYAAGGQTAPNRDARWHLNPTPPDPDRWTWGRPGDPMATALAEVGLTVADLALAAVSHLHVDHSGGIPALAAAGVPVALQRAELDFARSGAARVEEGFHPPDWSAPGTGWRLLDGDTELAPGVWAVSTPGHTPGHMSFRVDLPATGTWLFAGDAADLAQNVLDGTPCGSVASGTAADRQRADQSFRRLLSVAADTDARLVPGHDQVVLTAVRHPPGGHR